MSQTADPHLLNDLHRLSIVRQLSAWPGQSHEAVAASVACCRPTHPLIATRHLAGAA